MSEPAKRETAKSTAQRTWSLVRDNGSDADELSVVVWRGGAFVTGKTGGRASGIICCTDEAANAVALSSISMDATETASRTSDSSAALANLLIKMQTKIKIRHENGLGNVCGLCEP